MKELMQLKLIYLRCRVLDSVLFWTQFSVDLLKTYTPSLYVGITPLYFTLIKSHLPSPHIFNLKILYNMHYC